MKWRAGLSWLLGLPFLACVGLASALFTSAHGDAGRVFQGCLAAAGAPACATGMALTQRAWRNREADGALARSAEWDARANRHDVESPENEPNQP